MKILNYEGTNLYINSLIPFPGYMAMMLFGLIFYRKSCESYLYDEERKERMMNMINHENIHKEQIKDFALFLKWCPPLQLLIGGIIFYLIYFFEWLIRLFINGKKAYKNISFEKEAFKYQLDFDYIKNKRKPFNQWRKIMKEDN